MTKAHLVTLVLVSAISKMELFEEENHTRFESVWGWSTKTRRYFTGNHYCKLNIGYNNKSAEKIPLLIMEQSIFEVL